MNLNVVSNDTVVGLTTAATLWVSAIVGMTIGLGFYTAGIIGGLIIFIILFIIKDIIALRRE